MWLYDTVSTNYVLLSKDVPKSSSQVLIEVNNSPSLNLTQIIPINDGKLPPIKKQRHGNNGGRDDRIALSRGDPCHCNDFPTVCLTLFDYAAGFPAASALGVRGLVYILLKLTSSGSSFVLSSEKIGSFYLKVHYHELSAVDEYVKVIAFGGTLDLLPKLTPAARAILKAEGGRNSQDIPGKGAGQCPKKYFFEAGSAGQV